MSQDPDTATFIFGFDKVSGNINMLPGRGKGYTAYNQAYEASLDSYNAARNSERKLQREMDRIYGAEKSRENKSVGSQRTMSESKYGSVAPAPVEYFRPRYGYAVRAPDPVNYGAVARDIFNTISYRARNSGPPKPKVYKTADGPEKGAKMKRMAEERRMAAIRGGYEYKSGKTNKDPVKVARSLEENKERLRRVMALAKDLTETNRRIAGGKIRGDFQANLKEAWSREKPGKGKPKTAEQKAKMKRAARINRAKKSAGDALAKVAALEAGQVYTRRQGRGSNNTTSLMQRLTPEQLARAPYVPASGSILRDYRGDVAENAFFQ